jgi:hypothetical protein
LIYGLFSGYNTDANPLLKQSLTPKRYS